MATVVQTMPTHTFTPGTLGGCRGEAVNVSLYKGSPAASSALNADISPSIFQDQEIQNYLMQDANASPELTELLGHKATNCDIMLLVFELMKMMIDSQEKEKVARNDERRMQLQNLDKEVANYKSQAKWMLFGYLGAGVLGIGSGLAPIVGHTHGKGILSALSYFDRFKGLKQRDFFEGMSKTLNTMKETQQAMGQIYGTKAEGERTRVKTLADNHKTDHEFKQDKVRSLGQQFKDCQDFIEQVLRMYHDVAMQR